MTTHCRRLLLLKHGEDKTHKKTTKKKTKRKEGVYLQVLGLPFHFWLSLLPFYFKRFLMTSSSQAIEKKTQRTRKEKKL
jgi:hypothetical protein